MEVAGNQPAAPGGRPGGGRRAEQARATRRTIVEAGRSLFAGQGYFATTVEAIAARAAVAPKTVYAVVGGKQGLLRLLVEEWDEDPVVGRGLARMHQLPDAPAVLALLSASVRSIVEEHGDVVTVLLASAPHDPVAAEGLARTTAGIRAAHGEVAEHLAARRALAEGVDVARAVDVLWFYFGLTSHRTLVVDCGWDPDEAERWLAGQSAAALLAARGRGAEAPARLSRA